MDYPFSEKVCKYDESVKVLKEFIRETEFDADYWVAIITQAFDGEEFLNAEDPRMAIITTDIWEKYLSPPSLLEYLMNSIYCSLIFSQLLPNGTKVAKQAARIEIGAHDDTRGCIGDYTADRYQNKIDIALGYLCDEHKEQISEYYGELYLKETISILERRWIGSPDEKNTVAYALKHIFNFDINKDSGFNKTFFDRIKESFYDIPGDLTKEILKIIVTALLTYFLVTYGLSVK